MDRDEASNWTTPYVSGQQRPHRKSWSRARRNFRSYDLKGTVLWELGGLTSLHVPTPFASRRPALRTVRLSDRSAEARVRRSGLVRRATSRSSLARRATRFVLWSNPALGHYATSSLAYRGHYYTLLDRGFLLCNDAKTGQEALRTAAYRDGCAGIYLLAVGITARCSR